MRLALINITRESETNEVPYTVQFNNNFKLLNNKNIQSVTIPIIISSNMPRRTPYIKKIIYFV